MIVSHSYFLVGIILITVMANAGKQVYTRGALEINEFSACGIGIYAIMLQDFYGC